MTAPENPPTDDTPVAPVEPGTTESVDAPEAMPADMAPEPVPAEPAAPAVSPEEKRAQLKSDLKWGVTFLMWFMLVVTVTAPLFQGQTPMWGAGPEGAENRTVLTAELFGTADTTTGAFSWLIPFQVLGVLLTAALTGAIVIALREGSE